MSLMKRTGMIALPVLTVVLAIAWDTAATADDKVNTGYFGGVAIMGYDPVAYFTESRAVKGSPDFSQEFLGETWQFASAEHMDMFAADPVQYAPQYGGYCAGELLYADVSTGITSNIDPEAWRIVDGKLYLFYNSGTADAFEQDAEEAVAKTDGNWPAVEARLAAQ